MTRLFRIGDFVWAGIRDREHRCEVVDFVFVGKLGEYQYELLITDDSGLGPPSGVPYEMLFPQQDLISEEEHAAHLSLESLGVK